MATDQVMLREKGGHAQAVAFGAEHAARLLKYPGSQWEKVTAEAASKTAEAAPKDAKPKAGSGAQS